MLALYLGGGGLMTSFTVDRLKDHESAKTDIGPAFSPNVTMNLYLQQQQKNQITYLSLNSTQHYVWIPGIKIKHVKLCI